MSDSPLSPKTSGSVPGGSVPEGSMLASVLTGPRRVEPRVVPIPKPGPGELQIRVDACGVCGSDIHMWMAGHGWSPTPLENFRMGHEFCGTVTDPGDSDFRVGQRVTFWANLYCGRCDMCRQGKEHLCREVRGTNYTGFVCNGAYAQYFTGRARNACLLPDTVSDLDAALIDPLMVAYHAVKHSSLRLNDRVLVVGSGIIGQFMGDLAKKQGATLLALSKVDDRQTEFVKRKGDFDLVLDGNDPHRGDVFREVSKGGFDVVFEAVGTADSLATCLDAVRPGGEIVAVGNSVTPTLDFSLNRLVLNEITLRGSVSCTRAEFDETIDLIARGVVDAESFVSDVYPLARLQDAFEKQVSKEPFLKAVVRPWATE